MDPRVIDLATGGCVPSPFATLISTARSHRSLTSTRARVNWLRGKIQGSLVVDIECAPGSPHLAGLAPDISSPKGRGCRHEVATLATGSSRYGERQGGSGAVLGTARLLQSRSVPSMLIIGLAQVNVPRTMRLASWAQTESRPRLSQTLPKQSSSPSHHCRHCVSVEFERNA